MGRTTKKSVIAITDNKKVILRVDTVAKGESVGQFYADLYRQLKKMLGTHPPVPSYEKVVDAHKSGIQLQTPLGTAHLAVRLTEAHCQQCGCLGAHATWCVPDTEETVSEFTQSDYATLLAAAK